jgi:osmotically inducible lipoprotein OsmB
MKKLPFVQAATALAVAAVLASCSSMTHKEKDTTIGAGSGAVAGAVVGGPVGAVVGAGVGAFAGHEVGKAHEQGKSITGEPMPRTR